MNGTADGWQRVHPASPFVRGWLALAALFFFFGRDTFERLLRGGPAFDERFAGRAPWLLLGGGAVLLLAVAGFVLSWYFTRYQVADGYVRVSTGILVKQQRQARLDRVQAIDVVQPLLARVLGLAELRFEVADAGQSAVHLAYLRVAEARRLRGAILAAGVKADAGEHRPPGDAARGTGSAPATANAEAPERPVLAVPPQRLAGSLLLSEQTVVLLLGAAASVWLSAATESRAFYLYLVPAGLGMLAAYWNSFSKGYNFTAAVSPGGIRLRYGLLDTLAQTLPPGRIQALRISQPPLWRPLGWYRIQVNVAGYGTPGKDGERSARTTLLPVGTLADVFALLALVLPDPGTPEPGRVFTAGLRGLAPEPDGFVTTPRRARLLAPLGWRRNGFTATGTALLIRSGRWWRHLVVVPHQRTQSMALHQGPLARLFGVVDLVLHTTSGPVAPRVVRAGLDQGRDLLDAQSARARSARRRDSGDGPDNPTGTPADPPAEPSLEIPVESSFQPPVESPQEGPQHG
ncbi:MAG TPA: PH domain-containing protein [Arthrobacter sp.]|nr:PH domain-containing protein [Arthrobacter sp.]